MYLGTLENVKLAPSAMNKQQWRVIKQSNRFHFYIDQDRFVKYIDLGIALCHFHLIVLEKGLTGDFKIFNPNLETKNHYIISWILTQN